MLDDIETRIVRIIAQQALIPESNITLNSNLNDLGLDSLSVVEIIFSLEEMFDITIQFNANEPTKSEFIIDSVSTIVSGVKTLMADKTF